jgi:hypothetical protein
MIVECERGNDAAIGALYLKHNYKQFAFAVGHHHHRRVTHRARKIGTPPRSEKGAE